MEPSVELTSTGLREGSITEGNLAENPVFVLSNKDAFPKDKVNGYTKRISYPPEKVGDQWVDRYIEISASQEKGFPTTLAFRLLVALVSEFDQQSLAAKRAGGGETATRIKTSISRLERMLDLPKSGRSVDTIKRALDSMHRTQISYRLTWYDKAKKGKATIGSSVLISGYQFPSKPQAGAASPDVLGWVELGPELRESVNNRYVNGVDLHYLNTLGTSPIACKLYGYLSKKDGNRYEAKVARAFGRPGFDYSEETMGIALKLGMQVTRPSVVKTQLGRALKMLATPLRALHGDFHYKFLENWDLSGDPSKVFVKFAKQTAPALAAGP